MFGVVNQFTVKFELLVDKMACSTFLLVFCAHPCFELPAILMSHHNYHILTTLPEGHKYPFLQVVTCPYACCAVFSFFRPLLHDAEFHNLKFIFWKALAHQTL